MLWPLEQGVQSDSCWGFQQSFDSDLAGPHSVLTSVFEVVLGIIEGVGVRFDHHDCSASTPHLVDLVGQLVAEPTADRIGDPTQHTATAGHRRGDDHKIEAEHRYQIGVGSRMDAAVDVLDFPDLSGSIHGRYR